MNAKRASHMFLLLFKSAGNLNLQTGIDAGGGNIKKKSIMDSLVEGDSCT